MSKDVEAEASATKTVSDLFPTEELNSYVDSTVKMIVAGKPHMDGKKQIAACHFYDTRHGKIGTFSSWMRGTPFRIYVGTETEVNEMKQDFYKMASEVGLSFKKSAKERAEDRKRENKKAKKKAKR